MVSVPGPKVKTPARVGAMRVGAFRVGFAPNEPWLTLSPVLYAPKREA